MWPKRLSIVSTSGWTNQIDTIGLSKPKKNITRDFSDGLLIAEIIHHYHPQLVELHNYINSSNHETKKANWELLKRKVFKKIGFSPSEELVQEVIDCQCLAVETLLISLRPVLVNKTSFGQNNPIKKSSVDKRSTGKGSKDKARKKSKEPKKDPPHVIEIRRLKEAIKLMEVKMDELSAVVKKKDERIKALENRLFQSGLKLK